MKRIVSLCLLLLFSCSFAVSFSAQAVEEEFLYADALTEQTSGGVASPVFCGGTWQYTYRSPETGTFVPMPGWKDDASVPSPVIYAVSPEQYENPASPYFYCMIREGVAIYPGVNVPLGITFLCPKDGTIRYVAFGYFADAVNSKNAAGNRVALYQDDTVIWEQQAVEYSANVAIDVSVDVKAGQRLTLALGGDGFSVGNAFCVSGAPTLQYTAVPSDPELPSPQAVTVENVTDSSFTVSWEPVDGAVGYKVLCDQVQVSPGVAYAGTSYTVTGLAPDKGVSVTVIALSAEGYLSLPSEALSVRTLKPVSSVTSAEGEAASDSSVSTKEESKLTTGTLLLWICVAGGVILLGIGAATLLLLRKKKR